MLPVKYVPRLEFDEVKTALEIAEDEYRRATDEAAKWDKISCVISDKCGEYNDELEALNKTFRNLAGRYKRSTKEDTRNRLYYQMRILYRQIEAIKPAVEWLQRMYDKASAQYLHERDKELAATRNVVNARAAAGLKFGVHINLELGGQKIPLSDNVKTIADAVNFICQNTNGLASWVIYTESVEGLTARRNIIAEGKNIDREILSALIKKHGDNTIVIDAEIAAPQKAKAPHFDTLSQRTKNFGNARWIEQFIMNGVIPAMANRVTLDVAKDYQHILPTDIEEGYKKFNPRMIELKPRRQVGFNS